MESGFYKKETSGNWLFGSEKIIGPFNSWELRKELKDTYDYPIDGWTWYDDAPQEYIDWMIEMGIYSTQSATQSSI
jgi:hypothetical protein